MNNDVVVTGDFAGTVDFGGGLLTSIGGSLDIFVAKYSGVDGRHLWSKSFGGSSGDRSRAVAVDANGNVIVSGYFIGSASFGGPTLTAVGYYEAFVAKYSGLDGSYLWSLQSGGSGSKTPARLAVDPSGNIVLIGTFSGAAIFGGNS